MNNDSFLISVVLPVYNIKETFFHEALKGMLGQTHANLEVVLINDGSTDPATGKLCERYARSDARIRYMKNEKNLGVAASLNRGISESRGDFVTIMSGDDIVDPGILKKKLAFLLENNLDVCNSFTEEIDERGKTIRLLAQPIVHEEIVKSLVKIPPISGPIFGKRTVFEKVRFNEAVRSLAEDYDFMCRVAKDYRVGNVPEYLYKYRIHAGSALRKNIGAVFFSIMRTKLKAIFSYRLVPFWYVIYLPLVRPSSIVSSLKSFARKRRA